MPAALKNIVVEQGADFRLLATWKDSQGNLVNLTGYSGKAQIRSRYTSPAPALELDVETGGAAGTVLCTATGETTAACDLVNDKGVWDLLLTDTDSESDPVRLLEGRVTLKRAATR